MKRLVVLLALFACKEPAKQAPPPPPKDAAPLSDELAIAISKRALEIFELRRMARDLRKQPEGEHAWPTDDVPDLDLTDAGNAFIAVVPGDEMSEILVEAPRFRIVHIDRDPLRISSKLHSDEKHIYSGPTYRPMLELFVRAKYALLVLGEYTRAVPGLGGDVTEDNRGRFNGIALLYAIESRKLLAAFSIAVQNRPRVKASKRFDFKNLEPLVLDLEEVAREALFAALKARFPAVKLPRIVYENAEYD